MVSTWVYRASAHARHTVESCPPENRTRAAVSPILTISECQDNPAYHKLDRYEANAVARRLLAAVGGVVAVVAQHEEVAGWHHEHGRIVVGPAFAVELDDAIGGTVG